MKVSSLTGTTVIVFLAIIGAFATRAANKAALKTYYYYNYYIQISSTLTISCIYGEYTCRIAIDDYTHPVVLFEENRNGALFTPVKSFTEYARPHD